MNGQRHWSLILLQLERQKLISPVVFLTLFLFSLGMAPQSAAAGNQDGAEPYLVKGQFELPLNVEEIKERWSELGYRQCQFESKDEGWTSDQPERHRGEHTHPWYALFAGKLGMMEFIIQDERFVLEPGDELYYPKDAVIAGKNLNDGRSEWFACWKYY